MDYLFLCSNIQDMKSLEMNEWKEKSQACSLHIIIWYAKKQQVNFIKYAILEGMEVLESWRTCES